MSQEFPVFPGCQPGPPTQESLSAAFGFRMPPAFADFVKTAYDHSGKNPDALFQLFIELFGFWAGGGGTYGYQQTPPELFTFGATGGDGEHYGYVIYAPELAEPDWPVGFLNPSMRNGVLIVGAGTREFFSMLLQAAASESDEPATRRQAEDLLKATGLSDGKWYEPHGWWFWYMAVDVPPERRVAPPVPDGWSYLPSADGIGVLAPAGLFAPEKPMGIGYNVDYAECLQAAEQAMRSGHPATALYILRQAYWNLWSKEPAFESLSLAMIDAYQALARPLLAESTRRRYERFRQGGSIEEDVRRSKQLLELERWNQRAPLRRTRLWELVAVLFRRYRNPR